MPSENVRTTEPDRRTRKRVARRDALLDLAADLVEREGVDGVTMAALAEAADYAPASLYTYFPSRSALLAALQQRALATLAEVARDPRRRVGPGAVGPHATAVAAGRCARTALGLLRPVPGRPRPPPA